MTPFLQVKDNAHGRADVNSLNNQTVDIVLSSLDTTRFPVVNVGFAVTIWDDITYPEAGDDPNMEKALVTAADIDADGSLTLHRTNPKLHTGAPKIALLALAQHISDLNAAVNVIESVLPDKADTAAVTASLNLKADAAAVVAALEAKQPVGDYATNASVAGKEPTITTLPVSKGGTGSVSMTGNRFLSSNSAGTAVFTSKVIPAGTVVGHNDTQTLTGKTMDGANNTFSNIPQAAIAGFAAALAAKANVNDPTFTGNATFEGNINLPNQINITGDWTQFQATNANLDFKAANNTKNVRFVVGDNDATPQMTVSETAITSDVPVTAPAFIGDGSGLTNLPNSGSSNDNINLAIALALAL